MDLVERADTIFANLLTGRALQQSTVDILSELEAYEGPSPSPRAPVINNLKSDVSATVASLKMAIKHVRGKKTDSNSLVGASLQVYDAAHEQRPLDKSGISENNTTTQQLTLPNRVSKVTPVKENKFSSHLGEPAAGDVSNIEISVSDGSEVSE